MDLKRIDSAPSDEQITVIIDVKKFFTDRRTLPVLNYSASTTRRMFSGEKIEIDPAFRERSIDGAEFYDCLFVKEFFSELTFENCKFVECRFIGCRFDHIEFHSCRFVNCLLLKPRFERVYLDPSSFEFDSNDWKRYASNVNTTLFQKIEANSKDIHQNDFAERAHIEFRRYRRSQSIYRLRRSTDWVGKIKAAADATIDFAYDWLLVYGFGLFRAIAITITLFYLGLGWVDRNWEELVRNDISLPAVGGNTFQKLYFLVVTSTTMGYGDTSPRSELGMTYVIVVAAMSVVWTATLTALIVKRLVK